MTRTDVALIEPDEWRGRGMASVLIAAGFEVLRYRTLEAFFLDVVEPRVVLISEAPMRGRERETLAELLEMLPDGRILVFSEVDALEVAAALFAHGAHGCFSLSLEPDRLVDAVRHVQRGKIWGTRESIVAALQGRAAAPAVEPALLEGDEMRLLRMLAEGLTNKEIAQRFGFAESTVKSRFNRLYRRFGVASRVQLLTAAIRRGFLSN